jgi:hypothetical protein
MCDYVTLLEIFMDYNIQSLSEHTDCKNH